MTDLSNTGRCYGLTVPSQMSCVGTLPPTVMILEGGVFGRWLGLHEVMTAAPGKSHRGVGCLPALTV